jgi:hypothetical protein
MEIIQFYPDVPEKISLPKRLREQIEIIESDLICCSTWHDRPTRHWTRAADGKYLLIARNFLGSDTILEDRKWLLLVGKLILIARTVNKLALELASMLRLGYLPDESWKRALQVLRMQYDSLLLRAKTCSQVA